MLVTTVIELKCLLHLQFIKRVQICWLFSFLTLNLIKRNWSFRCRKETRNEVGISFLFECPPIIVCITLETLSIHVSKYHSISFRLVPWWLTRVPTPTSEVSLFVYPELPTNLFLILSDKSLFIRSQKHPSLYKKFFHASHLSYLRTWDPIFGSRQCVFEHFRKLKIVEFKKVHILLL